MRRPAPVFLARRAYRYRRLLDAARLLPIAGLVLFMVPVLWQPAATPAADTGRGASYLFIVWAILILAALVISHRIVTGGAAGSDTPGNDVRAALPDPAMPGPDALPPATPAAVLPGSGGLPSGAAGSGGGGVDPAAGAGR